MLMGKRANVALLCCIQQLLGQYNSPLQLVAAADQGSETETAWVKTLNQFPAGGCSRSRAELHFREPGEIA